MDIELANKYIESEKDRIFCLFRLYQMIEIMLFLKLYPSEIITPLREKAEFEKLNKELNSKTLGGMTTKYLKKYPNDKYKLKLILKIVAPQRNHFMHSFWIFLSATKDEKQAKEYGDLVLKDFEKNANELFNTLLKTEFG